MKKFKILCSLLFLMLLLFQACKKDTFYEELPDEPITERSGHIVFNVSDQSLTSRSSGEWAQTVLGVRRQNPFTVEKMAEAAVNLYVFPTQQSETTHLYVKFLPASLDDIVLLEETDEFFFDFPLEYEVIEMGDYYQEAEEGNFPELYAVVDPDFVFPDVSYEIIGDLYLD